MLCPNCHAETPGNVATCPSCGAGLSGVDDLATLVGFTAPAPLAAPIAPKPATAAGVVTPPPDPSDASKFARPSTPRISLNLEPGADFGPRYRIESLIGEGGM